MLRYDGRVAIVTGAGQGLGREYALLLASRGALVLVNDSAPGRAEAVVAEITAVGGTAVASTDSVATAVGGRTIVERAVERFGTVDIVINNAGIIRDHAFHNMTDAEVTDVLGVHLAGTFWVTKPAWQVMRARGYGRLVFTTSLSGLLGNFGQANYGAAKTGVIGLARVLATEGQRHNIRSNVIAPLAQTSMADSLTAFHVGMLAPQDVAAAVGYLVHESCSLSGEVISAVGGRFARYFIGLTNGVYLPSPTPEAFEENLSQICDDARFSEPRSMSEEIDAVLELINQSS
jgi:NAD(P)-dependent dehydrogenase (short-subunit alcohol dehydrogenase family)